MITPCPCIPSHPNCPQNKMYRCAIHVGPSLACFLIPTKDVCFSFGCVFIVTCFNLRQPETKNTKTKKRSKRTCNVSSKLGNLECVCFEGGLHYFLLHKLEETTNKKVCFQRVQFSEPPTSGQEVRGPIPTGRGGRLAGKLLPLRKTHGR